MLRRDLFRAAILPLLWPFRVRPRVGIDANRGKAVTTLQKALFPSRQGSGVILLFTGDAAFVWLDVTLARPSEPVLRGSCSCAPGAYAKTIMAMNKPRSLTVVFPPHGSSLTFIGRLVKFANYPLCRPPRAEFSIEICNADALLPQSNPDQG